MQTSWTQRVVGGYGTVANMFRPTSDESIRIGKAMKKYGYKMGHELGRGAYAKVIKGEHVSGRSVAIKIIDRRKGMHSQFVSKFLPRELALLSKIRHPNIIRIELVLDDGICVCEVQEYAEHGDLLRFIQKIDRLQETDAQLLFLQLTKAVNYLHDKDIVHRDLKCDNLLLDKYDNVKIGDFGFVRILPSSELSMTLCGSKAYSAPELLKGQMYQGQMIDVWSTGVILYIVLTGLMPYDERDVDHMIEKQMSHKITYHSSVSSFASPMAKRLIYEILDPNPQKRPSAQKLQQHPWLGGIKWEMRSAPITVQQRQ